MLCCLLVRVLGWMGQGLGPSIKGQLLRHRRGIRGGGGEPEVGAACG